MEKQFVSMMNALQNRNATLVICYMDCRHLFNVQFNQVMISAFTTEFSIEKFHHATTHHC